MSRSNNFELRISQSHQICEVTVFTSSARSEGAEKHSTGLGTARQKRASINLSRAVPLTLAVVLFATNAILAGEPLAPTEIQTTFFTGQAFTATTPSGTKFKMTFTQDGKMTREPLAQRGNKSTGTWKLNAKGFCTTWGHSKSNCFTIVPSGGNKWSVQGIATTIATTVAVWSK